MTSQADYLAQLTTDNVAVLFIKNQRALTLRVQSIDLSARKTDIEGLARLARTFALPVAWTNAINEAALHPLIQAGATSTSAQSDLRRAAELGDEPGRRRCQEPYVADHGVAGFLHSCTLADRRELRGAAGVSASMHPGATFPRHIACTREFLR